MKSDTTIAEDLFRADNQVPFRGPGGYQEMPRDSWFMFPDGIEYKTLKAADWPRGFIVKRHLGRVILYRLM